MNSLKVLFTFRPTGVEPLANCYLMAVKYDCRTFCDGRLDTGKDATALVDVGLSEE